MSPKFLRRFLLQMTFQTCKKERRFSLPWLPQDAPRNWRLCAATNISCPSTAPLFDSSLRRCPRRIVSLISAPRFESFVFRRRMTLLPAPWRRWRRFFRNVVNWTSPTTSYFPRRRPHSRRFQLRVSRRCYDRLSGVLEFRRRRVRRGRSAYPTPSLAAPRSTRCCWRVIGRLPKPSSDITFVLPLLWQDSDCCRGGRIDEGVMAGRRSREEQLLFLFSLLLFPASSVEEHSLRIRWRSDIHLGRHERRNISLVRNILSWVVRTRNP